MRTFTWDILGLVELTGSCENAFIDEIAVLGSPRPLADIPEEITYLRKSTE